MSVFNVYTHMLMRNSVHPFIKACSEKMLVRDKQHAAAPRSLQQVMYHGCFLCMQQACFAANIQLSRRRSPCSLTVHTPGTSHLFTHWPPLLYLVRGLMMKRAGLSAVILAYQPPPTRMELRLLAWSWPSPVRSVWGTANSSSRVGSNVSRNRFKRLVTCLLA